MHRLLFLRYNEPMSTRRNYIKASQSPEATDAQIALAEKIIDAYVGVQDKYIKSEIDGEATSLLGGNVVIDTSTRSSLHHTDNYFDRCVIEILSGDAAGELRQITGSDESAQSITYDGSVITDFAVGDIFKIYQLAKFPRAKDVFSRSNDAGQSKYYKSIPRAVQDAVIAQVAYILELGDEYFSGNDSDVSQESIGNYSYSRGGANGSGGSQTALIKMVAPQARAALKGIKNSLGRLEV